mmetsp:Transcript_27265/g.76885  ORF Transcript_27265/g.76885 Transcript_27265/m.76885 type:complete len:341 (-) Transcript_27265:1163-2185(-)
MGLWNHFLGPGEHELTGAGASLAVVRHRLPRHWGGTDKHSVRRDDVKHWPAGDVSCGRDSEGQVRGRVAWAVRRALEGDVGGSGREGRLDAVRAPDAVILHLPVAVHLLEAGVDCAPAAAVGLVPVKLRTCRRGCFQAAGGLRRHEDPSNALSANGTDAGSHNAPWFLKITAGRLPVARQKGLELDGDQVVAVNRLSVAHLTGNFKVSVEAGVEDLRPLELHREVRVPSQLDRRCSACLLACGGLCHGDLEVHGAPCREGVLLKRQLKGEGPLAHVPFLDLRNQRLAVLGDDGLGAARCGPFLCKLLLVLLALPRELALEGEVDCAVDPLAVGVDCGDLA